MVERTCAPCNFVCKINLELDQTTFRPPAVRERGFPCPAVVSRRDVEKPCWPDPSSPSRSAHYGELLLAPGGALEPRRDRLPREVHHPPSCSRGSQAAPRAAGNETLPVLVHGGRRPDPTPAEESVGLRVEAAPAAPALHGPTPPTHRDRDSSGSRPTFFRSVRRGRTPPHRL